MVMSNYFLGQSVTGNYTLGQSFDLIALAVWIRMWEVWLGY